MATSVFSASGLPSGRDRLLPSQPATAYHHLAADRQQTTAAAGGPRHHHRHSGSLTTHHHCPHRPVIDSHHAPAVWSDGMWLSGRGRERDFSNGTSPCRRPSRNLTAQKPPTRVHYVYQPLLGGDGRDHCASGQFGGRSGYSLAGVMIRETLKPRASANGQDSRLDSLRRDPILMCAPPPAGALRAPVVVSSTLPDLDESDKDRQHLQSAHALGRSELGGAVCWVKPIHHHGGSKRLRWFWRRTAGATRLCGHRHLDNVSCQFRASAPAPVITSVSCHPRI